MKIDVAECIRYAEHCLTVERVSPPIIFDNEKGTPAHFQNWAARDIDGTWVPDENEAAFNASVCFAYWADGSVSLLSRDEDAVREFAMLWELER